jgi:hypothetical protein
LRTREGKALFALEKPDHLPNAGSDNAAADQQENQQASARWPSSFPRP